MSFDREKANLLLSQFLLDRNNPYVKKQLVEIHTPLAIKIALDFFKSFRQRFSEEDLSDLIQESCLGIFDALKNDLYDPQKAQIQTYIGWWCLSKCRNYLKKTCKSNRLIFWGHKNNAWTFDEKECQIPNECKNLYFLWDSYKLNSKEEDKHDDKYHEHLMLFFDNLPIKDRKIFYERFFLIPEITLEEIGRSLNLTKERVRQIEADLKLRLKDHFNGFDGFYYENIKANLTKQEKEILGQFHQSLSENEKYIFQERILKSRPMSRKKLSNKFGLAIETISLLEKQLQFQIQKLIMNQEKQIENRISM